LPPLIACCGLGHFARVTAAGSVILSHHWKNNRLRNGTTLTSISLTQQSVSGDSDSWA